jgi:metal-responsive CopG/Arc/MetJ family transcriptional regulator
MATSNYQRINITLPVATIKLLDRRAAKRGRSAFIDHAVRRLLSESERKAMREGLIKGYKARAARDLALTKEWEPLDDEAWALIKD